MECKQQNDTDNTQYRHKLGSKIYNARTNTVESLY